MWLIVKNEIFTDAAGASKAKNTEVGTLEVLDKALPLLDGGKARKIMEKGKPTKRCWFNWGARGNHYQTWKSISYFVTWKILPLTKDSLRLDVIWFIMWRRSRAKSDAVGLSQQQRDRQTEKREGWILNEHPFQDGAKQKEETLILNLSIWLLFQSDVLMTEMSLFSAVLLELIIKVIE